MHAFSDYVCFPVCFAYFPASGGQAPQQGKGVGALSPGGSRIHSDQGSTDLYIKWLGIDGKWLGNIQPMCSDPGHSWQGPFFLSKVGPFS